METPAVRDRAGLPHSCKKIEYVAAELAIGIALCYAIYQV
jgi:hypothetical protein